MCAVKSVKASGSRAQAEAPGTGRGSRVWPHSSVELRRGHVARHRGVRQRLREATVVNSLGPHKLWLLL